MLAQERQGASTATHDRLPNWQRCAHHHVRGEMVTGRRGTNEAPRLGIRETEALVKEGLRCTHSVGRENRTNACEQGRGTADRRADQVGLCGRTERDGDGESRPVVADWKCELPMRHRDNASLIEVVLETEKVTHDADRVQHRAASWHEQDVRDLVTLPLALLVRYPYVSVAHGQNRLNSSRCEHCEPRVVVGHADDVLGLVDHEVCRHRIHHGRDEL
mmetsp:Transcript_55672/g.133409  ORF Transcript_55672/g.133409 Transcript_55672/m.133409 type:complete len:218 (-) Transcript_55672:768-1421(-)